MRSQSVLIENLRLVFCVIAVFCVTAVQACAATTTINTPGAYSYTVPVGVTKLQVRVAGAGGGGGGRDTTTTGNGGQGALATITLNVSPGQVLTGTIGAGGITGWTGGQWPGFVGCDGGGAGGAGFGTGGTGGNANCPSTQGGYSGGGGGGGGSTSLLLAGTNVAVAGGGGGGGGSTNGGVGGNGGTSASVTVAATCTTAAGTTGASFTGDGGGGGGGGSGYTGGGGGTSAADGASPTGGGAGTSCYSSNAAVVSGVVTVGGGTGAIGQTATSATSNGAGGNGWVVITTFPSLTITMVSNGAIDSFTFTGSNGWVSQTISTVTAGSGVTGALQTFTNASTATTITQAIPANFTMASVICSGMGAGGTETTTLASGLLSFNAAAMAMGSDITCTVTDTAQAPTIAFQKALGTTGRIAAADQFTLQATGTGAPSAVTTTGSGTSITSAAMSFTATSATSYTLNEAMAAGSTSPLSSYLQSAVCTNGNSLGTSVSALTTVPITFTPKLGDSISCTITNTPVNPSLSIVKTYSTSTTPVLLGQVITYTYVVANIGNVPMTNVQVKDMHGSPATLVPLGAGGITNETLTNAGPLGAAASPDTTPNNGIWSTLAQGATVTFTYTYTVTQADIDHG